MSIHKNKNGVKFRLGDDNDDNEDNEDNEDNNIYIYSNLDIKKCVKWLKSFFE